jgi:anaerobic ribonucleoside-triphosphate reductase activating protein
MLNGQGLRVVLWCSGCSHRCPECQNPITWDPDCGLLFDEEAKKEIFEELSKDYISGITFSGGDPLHENNLSEVLSLIKEIKEKFPEKNIWLYTGYTWENIFKENKNVLSPEENNENVSEENKEHLSAFSEVLNGSKIYLKAQGIIKENNSDNHCTKEECLEKHDSYVDRGRCGKISCDMATEFQAATKRDDSEEKMKIRREIVSLIDVLVDGPFINSQKDIQLHWKGSANQKVIDVQKTLASGDTVICEE